MIVQLDTSALVDALTGPRRSLDRLAALVSEGHRVAMSSLVLFEWLRGPRLDTELLAQEELFPRGATIAFGPTEAEVATKLYRTVRRPRGREVDLAIAACAIASDAGLWTLNRPDFDDIDGLRLV